jgi:hypothetical protein
MSARAQREMMNRQTFYEQGSHPVDPFQPSTKIDETTLPYSMDSEQNRRRYPANGSNDSIPRSHSPETNHHQGYSQSGHVGFAQAQPLSKRVSVKLSNRLSMFSLRGENAPLTGTDEKRSEEEKRAHDEEEHQLDEEEKQMLKKGLFNWTELRQWRFWFRKEWWSEFDSTSGTERSEADGSSTQSIISSLRSAVSLPRSLPFTMTRS